MDFKKVSLKNAKGYLIKFVLNRKSVLERIWG